MKPSRCTCCGKWCTFRYPYKRTMLCARCLRIFVIDGILSHPPVRAIRRQLRRHRRHR